MPAKNATITAREVVTHPTFWLLAGSFFVCGGTANGLIGTHLIPHEIEIGIPQIAAASLLGIMGGLNMVGTIFSGWMIDKVQPQRWLALVYALRGVSLLILPFVHDFTGLVFFAIIYGLDWFATVPPSMAITADTFGRQNVGKVYGWIFMSHQIGAAIMASAAGAHAHLDGRLSVCFSVRRRDRDDSGGIGAADQDETQGSRAAGSERSTGGSISEPSLVSGLESRVSGWCSSTLSCRAMQ